MGLIKYISFLKRQKKENTFYYCGEELKKHTQLRHGNTFICSAPIIEGFP